MLKKKNLASFENVGRMLAVLFIVSLHFLCKGVISTLYKSEI